jgi:hypothetical protein
MYGTELGSAKTQVKLANNRLCLVSKVVMPETNKSWRLEYVLIQHAPKKNLPAKKDKQIDQNERDGLKRPESV